MRRAVYPGAPYARALLEHGYIVDCSVTPHVSWKPYLGDPAGQGGPDFTRAPEGEYFVDLDDVARPGGSRLLEVPVTIFASSKAAERVRRRLPERSLARAAWNRAFPAASWLRPGFSTLRRMLGIVDRAVRERRSYAEFIIHSSELMPGGSPNFPRERDVERLFADMEQVFSYSQRHFCGRTLTSFARCVQ